MRNLSPKILKYVAMSILVLPIGFLLLFTVGEVVGGDISGLGHLIQLLPLVVLAIVAWKWPRVAGLLLVGLGLLLAAVYPFTMSGRLPVQDILGIEAALFLPPVFAGILLLLSSRSRTR